MLNPHHTTATHSAQSIVHNTHPTLVALWGALCLGDSPSGMAAALSGCGCSSPVRRSQKPLASGVLGYGTEKAS